MMMKKQYLTLIALLLFTTIYAQEDASHYRIGEYESPVLNYKQDVEKINKKDTLVFNPKMLNILFAEQISSYFNGSEDLTISTFYASLDASENSLSVGFTLPLCFDCDKLDKISYVISGGFKAKSEDRFTTLYENGEFAAVDAGITFRLTKIFGGTIDFKRITKNDDKTVVLDRKALLQKNREEYLYDAYDAKVKKYLDGDYRKELAKLKRKFKYDKRENKDIALEDFHKEKINEFYVKMAEEEVKFINENDLYRFTTAYWISFDAFIPLNKNKYTIIPDLNENAASTIIPYEKTFLPINASVSLTKYWNWSAGPLVFATGRLSMLNNNTILANDVSSKSFETTSNQLLTGTIINQQKVYETPYENFGTGRLELEVVAFLIKDKFGISPAIEFNIGTYNKTNWKLGIPVSLKDKEGKPTVNFELQWKEIQTLNRGSNHFVGISANFLFGKFLN